MAVGFACEMDSPPRLTLTTVRLSFSSQLTWLGKTVGVLVNRLSRYIAPNPIVANEEVFIPGQVLEGYWRLVSPARICKPSIPNIDLEPAATNVGRMTPEHLCDHIAARLCCSGHTKVIHNAGSQASDVTIPEVINDLGEVDVLGEGPGHILPDPRWVVEFAGAPLSALLVEDPREATHPLAWVADHRALVCPDLSHIRKFRVPGKGRKAGHLGEN